MGSAFPLAIALARRYIRLLIAPCASMSAETSGRFLVSEVIDFRKSRPVNHREIDPSAVAVVSAHQAARKSEPVASHTSSNYEHL